MSSSPETASASSSSATTIKIYAVVISRQVFTVVVKRHAPIPELLETLKAHMMRVNMPHELTAYTAQRGDGWIHGRSDVYWAIRRGEWDVAAPYCTPESRLDPNKTVDDYFGNAPTDLHIHVLLKWTSKAMAEHQANVERWRARAAALRLLRQEERAAEEAKKASANNTNSSASWWQPVASLLSSALGCTEPMDDELIRKPCKPTKQD